MAGVGVNFKRLDYIYNPRKGFFVKGTASIGKKESESLNFVVDNSGKSSLTQYEFLINSGVFIPAFKSFSFYFSNHTGYINSPEIYDNEMYKIGGFSVLRGFDEESVLASFYSVMSVELRFLYEKNSNLFVFFDGAYYEKESGTTFVCDYPFGFGIGSNFETKAGIFTISYSLGKQFDNPINFSSAKIHFGISNRF